MLKKYILSNDYCIKNVADLTVLINICDNTIIALTDNTSMVLSMFKDKPYSIQDIFLSFPKKEQTEDCKSGLIELIGMFVSRNILEVYNEIY